MSSLAPVQPGYSPSCSALSASSEFNPSEAAGFDLTTYTYYKTLWPTVTPGIVLGALAGVGFCFFLAWLCVQCLRRRGPTTKVLLESGATGIELQFISGSEYHSQYLRPPAGRLRRAVTAGRALKGAVALLALALVGVSAWGMAASIQETNHTVPSFWSIVDAADAKVANATTTLRTLSGQMAQLSEALGLLSTHATRVAAVLASLGISQEDVSLLGAAPASVKEEVDGLQEGVGRGIELLQTKGSQTIESMRRDLYTISKDASDKWRFIPIAVVFGLTILVAALAGVLVVWMRWPKTSSISVALLWLVVVALMFLGVGLMRGVYEVGQDSCLYLEPFALRYARDHISDEGDRTKVLAALEYYFGYNDIPDDQVAEVLVGTPTRQVHATLHSDQVQSILRLLDPTGQDLLRKVGQLASVPPDDTNKILAVMLLLPRLEQSVASLEQQLQRPNVEPVYHQAKEWVCCDVADSAFNVWVAWTATGCLGWVLAALCSARVVLHTLGIRRTQKRLEAAQPVAGLPPAFPYVGDSPPASENQFRGDSAVVVTAVSVPPSGPASPISMLQPGIVTESPQRAPAPSPAAPAVVAPSTPPPAASPPAAQLRAPTSPAAASPSRQQQASRLPPPMQLVQLGHSCRVERPSTSASRA